MSKEAKFVWGKEQEAAFQKVKEILSSYPNLGMPDWNKEFHIETDASGSAVGAILFQLDPQDHKIPLHYHSRPLSSAQSKWSATERELAILDATRKFRVYFSEVSTYILTLPPPIHTQTERSQGKVNKVVIRVGCP